MADVASLPTEFDYTLPIRDKTGAVIAQVLVSPPDFVWLSNFRWSLNRGGYAVSWFEDRVVYMHRLILGLQAGDGRQGDHANGNRLDNRRSNLRRVTTAQNAQNKTVAYGRSGIRGVYWDDTRQRWRADAHIGKHVFQKRFLTQAEAIAAVRAWRQEHMPFSSEISR